MAVVQISRIQIRRGKEQNTGLPQLASGELGWAVDTQRLYIGNGAVSEGAPYVGNTRILTEHENIFELAGSYTYKNQPFMQTGASPSTPVERTLQDRLDDIVSIRSFGATGDGSIQTAALQRAINQLFLNNATRGSETSRVVLHLDPGVYVIDDTVFIPPFVTIKGAGKDKTIIRSNGFTSKPMFTTVNANSIPGTPADDSTSTTLNQATTLSISDLTIHTTADTNIINLQSCKDSHFSNIKFLGNWTTVDPLGVGIGLQLGSLSTEVSSNNNKFIDCDFIGLSYAVKSNYDIKNNQFVRCTFKTLGYGVVFGENTILGTLGQLTGPMSNSINDSTFENIHRHGLWVENGSFNSSINNRYVNVGNDGGNETNATYSVINFVRGLNVSEQDYFSRSSQLGYDQNLMFNNPYVPELEGTNFSKMGYANSIALGSSGTYTRLFRLPAKTSVGYDIDYFYNSDGGASVIKGKLNIVFDKTTDTVSHSEEYDQAGDTNLESNLRFRVGISDEDIDGTVDTLVVEVLNSTSDVSAKFQYKISVLS